MTDLVIDPGFTTSIYWKGNLPWPITLGRQLYASKDKA